MILRCTYATLKVKEWLQEKETDISKYKNITTKLYQCSKELAPIYLFLFRLIVWDA
jgi:hypothetical protein